jgi:hypothetical protein
MQHGEAEASDPIMRRRLLTAERTMTRQVISAELTERPLKWLDQNPRNKRTVPAKLRLMLMFAGVGA